MRVLAWPFDTLAISQLSAPAAARDDIGFSYFTARPCGGPRSDPKAFSNPSAKRERVETHSRCFSNTLRSYLRLSVTRDSDIRDHVHCALDRSDALLYIDTRSQYGSWVNSMRLRLIRTRGMRCGYGQTVLCNNTSGGGAAVVQFV